MFTAAVVAGIALAPVGICLPYQEKTDAKNGLASKELPCRLPRGSQLPLLYIIMKFTYMHACVRNKMPAVRGQTCARSQRNMPLCANALHREHPPALTRFPASSKVRAFRTEVEYLRPEEGMLAGVSRAVCRPHAASRRLCSGASTVFQVCPS